LKPKLVDIGHFGIEVERKILRKCISIAECEIFLAGYFQTQEAVMKFSKDNVSDCEEILSTQEEADTLKQAMWNKFTRFSDRNF
jgi:hypothetical protein